MLAQPQNSHSPSSPQSLSSKISALGARLTRSLSTSETATMHEEDRDSISEDLPVLKDTKQERSVSRGRDAFHSTGRGGIGNIRQASASRDARPDSGPGNLSRSRGREREPLVDTNKMYSTGRGGAGNLRSPSRNLSKSTSSNTHEEEVIQNYITSKHDTPISTGRGGAGNISGSRSRSRGPAATVFATGRGGAGNITSGDGLEAELRDEEERRKFSRVGHNEGFHSTGRGGAANLTTSHEPGIERQALAHHEFESTGRGGAGNIVSDRSRSRS